MHKNSFIAIAQILAWGGSLDCVPAWEKKEFGQYVLGNKSTQIYLREQLLDLVKKGEQSMAVKLYREHTGAEIKDATVYVDSLDTIIFEPVKKKSDINKPLEEALLDLFTSETFALYVRGELHAPSEEAILNDIKQMVEAYQK